MVSSPEYVAVVDGPIIGGSEDETDGGLGGGERGERRVGECRHLVMQGEQLLEYGENGVCREQRDLTRIIAVGIVHGPLGHPLLRMELESGGAATHCPVYVKSFKHHGLS